MTTSSNAIDRMTGLGDDIAKALSSARKPPQAPPLNFPAGGEFSTEPTGYARDVARLPQVESALSELPQLKAKAQEEFLRGTQAQTEAKAKAQTEAATMKREGLEKIYEAPEVQQETIEFKPTRMEMEDYKALAGLLVGAAAIFGAGGKGSAMYALSALNGMMSGYNKGRADLFKQQSLEFDKAMKSVQEKNKQALDALARMKENLVAKTDEFLAEKSQQIAIDSGGILAAQLRMNELDAAEKTLTNLQNGLDKRITSHEAAMARLAEQQAARIERERHNRAMERLAGERLAEQKKDKDKPLSAPEIRKLEGLDSISKGLEELSRDFKSEYASLGAFGAFADLSLEAKRRFGDQLGDKLARETVAWWSKYNRLQAPNRHALFGATLTGNELQNYRSFTSKPSDAADIIRDSLKDQMTYTSDLARSQRQSFDTAGYKVPPVSPVNYLGSFGEGRQAAPQGKESAPASPALPKDWDIKEVK